jgi:hypothetical protein
MDSHPSKHADLNNLNKKNADLYDLIDEENRKKQIENVKIFKDKNWSR